MPRYCFLERDSDGNFSSYAMANEASFVVDICRDCYGKPWPLYISSDEEDEVVKEIAEYVFTSEKRYPSRRHYTACAVEEGGDYRDSDIGIAHCRFGDEATMVACADGHNIDHPPYEDMYPAYRCAICTNSLNEKDY